MTLALSLAEKKSEDIISQLIVVDMAPVKYVLSHRLSEYVEAMKNMDDMPRGMVKTLADADRILEHFEKVRQPRRRVSCACFLP